VCLVSRSISMASNYPRGTCRRTTMLCCNSNLSSALRVGSEETNRTTCSRKGEKNHYSEDKQLHLKSAPLSVQYLLHQISTQRRTDKAWQPKESLTTWPWNCSKMLPFSIPLKGSTGISCICVLTTQVSYLSISRVQQPRIIFFLCSLSQPHREVSCTKMGCIELS
jgi:hypothetical protein